MRTIRRVNPWVLLGFTVGLAITSRTMLAPLVPLFALDLGASSVLIGGLISAGFIGPLFLAVPFGALVDRHGERLFIVVGALLLGVAPLIVAVEPSLLLLGVTQVLVGIGHLFLAVAGQALVAQHAGEERLVAYYGVYAAVVSGGQFVGPLLGGLLVDSVGFRETLLYSGVISLAALFIALHLDTEGAHSRSATSALGSTRKVGRFISTPSIQAAILSSSSVLIGVTVYQTFLPVHMSNLSFSATLVGMVMSIVSLTAVVVRPFIAQIVRVAGGEGAALFLAVAITGVSLGAIAYSSSILVLVLVSILFGLGRGVSQPLTIVPIVETVAPSERGVALGLRLTGNRFSQVLAPVVLGAVATQYGLSTTFLVSGAFVAVIAVAVACFRRSSHL